jgi:hypothetical protein
MVTDLGDTLRGDGRGGHAATRHVVHLDAARTVLHPASIATAGGESRRQSPVVGRL